MNDIDLKNKTAVVTGGVQGFGLAIVNRFIKSGAHVVIWDKDKDLLENLKIDNIEKISVDVTNFDSVQSLQ